MLLDRVSKRRLYDALKIRNARRIRVIAVGDDGRFNRKRWVKLFDELPLISQKICRFVG